MVETIDDSIIPARRIQRRSGCRRAISSVRIVTALIAGLALAWMAYLLIAGRAVQVHWTVQVALAAAALLSSALVFIQQHSYWQRPTEQLQQGIRDVLDGKGPIEALSRIGGGPSTLVPVIQEALRELKIQQSQVHTAHREMRQRVANRTDALERTIGALRQQASRDPLTGLYNRRLLQDHLPQLIARCAADGIPLVLLMIDVDYFKLVNDTLGHAAGDRLLTDVGQIIRSALREEDLAFRCGGDEFVVVLPGQGRETGEALARRLVDLMDALSRTLRVPQPPRLSIGVATLDDAPELTAEALLAEADSRLYQLKNARRPLRTPAA